MSLSTEIFILAIGRLLFISNSILYEFVMLPDVNILQSPQEEECTLDSSGNRCSHLAVHSSKRLNTLSVIISVCFDNT